MRLDSLTERLAGRNWLAVVGLFDPLTAIQADRMAEFASSGRAVCALILDEPDTLFPAEARAALMAALRSVDLVAIAKNDEWRPLLAGLSNVEISEDALSERARSASFCEFVLQRGSGTR
jgi:hypothetical protein